MSRIWVLLLLLLASSLVQSGRFDCPPLPASLTCSCSLYPRRDDAGCTLKAFRDLSITDPRLRVWNLKLKNLRLGHLGKSLFRHLRVKRLSAFNCSVTSIDEDAFDGLVEYLEYLYLGKNKLERVPTAALGGLVNLIHLNLYKNQIASLHAGAFRGLTSLMRLSLSENEIKSVDDLAFEGIGGNFTQVELEDNGLNSIPYRPIRNLKYLQKLKLQGNKITNLVQEGFAGIAERLEILQLSNNQIEEIPERAFANLKMLVSLYLSGNRIRHIHPRAFEGTESKLNVSRAHVACAYPTTLSLSLPSIDAYVGEYPVIILTSDYSWVSVFSRFEHVVAELLQRRSPPQVRDHWKMFKRRIS